MDLNNHDGGSLGDEYVDPDIISGPAHDTLDQDYARRSMSAQPLQQPVAPMTIPVLRQGQPHVMAYFDLSSYLYLSRLIHDASLITPELSVLLDRLYRSYIRTRAHVNAYRTSLLSRYSATILLNARTRVSATYLPILYGHSHAHSPFLVDSFRVIPFAISLTREAIPYCGLRSFLHMIVYLTAH